MKPSFKELREHLLVQKKVLIDDEFGGFLETWENYKSIWAKVEFASSRDITSHSLKELLSGKRESLRHSIYRITLREDKNLPKNIRFNRLGKILKVISQSIQNSNAEGYTTLFACEI